MCRLKLKLMNCCKNQERTDGPAKPLIKLTRLKLKLMNCCKNQEMTDGPAKPLIKLTS